jgi:hypothetical protein
MFSRPLGGASPHTGAPASSALSPRRLKNYGNQTRLYQEKRDQEVFKEGGEEVFKEGGDHLPASESALHRSVRRKVQRVHG